MELKKYFLGACIGILIFILAFTFGYIETFTLLKVLLALSVLTYIYYMFRDISDTLSFHFEKRLYYRTTNELNLWEGDECIEVRKYEDIVFGKFLLLIGFIVLYVVFGLLIGNLRFFFHEMGHLIVALSFNCQILDVIVSVTGGYVSYIEPSSLTQNNFILVSGTLWLFVVGTIFLIALHQDKKMSLTLNIPLSLIIWIELIDELKYWFASYNRGRGDAYDLIINNSGLDPLIVTISSFILLILLSFFVFFSLGYKMYYQFMLILDELIPDLTIFNAQEGKSFFTLENQCEERDRIN